jgi:hypothetical protein
MAKKSEDREPWPGYLGYPTEDSFIEEASRFLGTRPKNCGATERQIAQVANTTVFTKAKTEVDADPSHTKGDRAFFASLRREAMLPTIKSLLNQGYSVRGIADALEISYGTAWYHCNKIKKRIRTRNINSAWKLDETRKHFVRAKVTRSQAAIAEERMVKAKAISKRERKAARRADILARQQSNG